MFFLDPIYNNSFGASYAIKDTIETTNSSPFKVQFIIGDVAIILKEEEIKNLLNVVCSAKKGCTCKKCQNKTVPKQIKCNSNNTELIFKSNKTNIVALEDLIKGTMFELQINSILNFHTTD